MQQLDNLLQIVPLNQIWESPIEGLTFHHSDRVGTFESRNLDPSICIVLQGKRKVCLGNRCYIFNNEQFAFCPVNIPVTIEVIETTTDNPYLTLSLKLDLPSITAILLNYPNLPQAEYQEKVSFDSWQLDTNLSDSVVRLLALLEKPEDIEFLAPLIKQEIYYHLLKGEQGEKIRQLINQNSHIQRVTQATKWLHSHFREPLNVNQLAMQIGMSNASFYQHFKRITMLSPLQYQKNLRLIEARRLITLKANTIANIAYEVGYESPSQFSREYSRYFGHSPKVDF